MWHVGHLSSLHWELSSSELVHFSITSKYLVSTSRNLSHVRTSSEPGLVSAAVMSDWEDFLGDVLADDDCSSLFSSKVTHPLPLTLWTSVSAMVVSWLQWSWSMSTPISTGTGSHTALAVATAQCQSTWLLSGNHCTPLLISHWPTLTGTPDTKPDFSWLAQWSLPGYMRHIPSVQTSPAACSRTHCHCNASNMKISYQTFSTIVDNIQQVFNIHVLFYLLSRMIASSHQWRHIFPRNYLIT